MSDDLPNPIALLEWLTAFAYEKLDASGDQTIYKSVHHPFLMSAGDMALYWFTFYHAKVAGDL